MICELLEEAVRKNWAAARDFIAFRPTPGLCPCFHSAVALLEEMMFTIRPASSTAAIHWLVLALN